MSGSKRSGGPALQQDDTGRPGNGVNRRISASRVFALAMAILLHTVLIGLLVLDVYRPKPQRDSEKPVEVVLDRRPPMQPLPPPSIRLAAPSAVQVVLPRINVAPDPQSPAPAESQTASDVGAAAGASQGGGMPIAPPQPAPHCDTTRVAYSQIVHDAIARYLDYSQGARLRNIQGIITLHFISDRRGRVLIHPVADSRVVRTFKGKTAGGALVPTTLYFQRVGAAAWAYDAAIDTGSHSVIIAHGTVSAGPDGTLAAAGEAAPGIINLHVPPDIMSKNGEGLTVEIGKAGDLFLLDNSAMEALEAAQPLPEIPLCLNMPNFNALMPFSFQLKSAH